MISKLEPLKKKKRHKSPDAVLVAKKEAKKATRSRDLTKPVLFRLEKNLYLNLKILSAEKGIPMSTLVENALNKEYFSI